jgi:hypothetical protein
VPIDPRFSHAAFVALSSSARAVLAGELSAELVGRLHEADSGDDTHRWQGVEAMLIAELDALGHQLEWFDEGSAADRAGGYGGTSWAGRLLVIETRYPAPLARDGRSIPPGDPARILVHVKLREHPS